MKPLRSRWSNAPAWWRCGCALATATVTAACHGRTPAPAPAASASAVTASPAARGVCASGGGQIDAEAYRSWFPRTSAGFCLDPNTDLRVFGPDATLPLSEAPELSALDLERLDRLGLREMVTVAYVEDRDEPARVTASVLRFSSAENAYGFFTERIAEAAESGHPVFRPLAAGADGVIGDATASTVRDKLVVRLDFTNRRLPPARLADAAGPVLSVLAKTIAAELPGDAVLPAAARALPLERRVPLSLRFDALDLLGLTGVGPGAFATYDDGAHRLRLALFVRPDYDAAKDVLKTLRRREGSRVLKHELYDATRVLEMDPKTGAGTEWIFGQKGVFVGGASFDAPPRAAPRGEPPERDRAVLEMRRLLGRLR